MFSALALGLASPPAVIDSDADRHAAIEPRDDGLPRAVADGSRAREHTTCTLEIQGIPPAVADSYKLRYADTEEALRSLGHVISFAGDEVTINLTGPRYYGYRTISREACLAGVVPLPVHRKAAALRFDGAPPNTIVECLAGALCPDAKPRLIGEGAPFPELPMELDQAIVELRFKSSGYRPKVQRVSLQPGANQIDVDLEPNCGCRPSQRLCDRAPTGGDFSASLRLPLVKPRG